MHKYPPIKYPIIARGYKTYGGVTPPSQDPGVSMLTSFGFFLHRFEVYSQDSCKMIIGNILPGVSGRCCEFVRLSRTLEAPPKVLYSVVHVVLRALELPREACGSTCGRLQSLEFGLVGTFSKNHGRP